MIIHRYADGSEGYEYEKDDEVEITGVIARGTWFQRVIGRIGTIIAFDGRKERRDHWLINPVDVRYADDWGPAGCMPWQVKPTASTIASASIVEAT